MKAEELAPQLRIGNLLYYKGTTNIAKVELIHNKHFDCRDEYGGFTPNGAYEPIPLSEEVLLKCRFEKCEKHENFYQIILNDWTKIYVAFHEKQYAVELSVSKHSFCPKVKHLHQLQNLYCSLTGEELKVSF